MKSRLSVLSLAVILALGLLGCSSQQGAVSTVEQEQILNAVRWLYYQQPNTPARDFTIDKVEGDRARVRIANLAAEAKPEFVFLRRTKGQATPAAAPSLVPTPGATNGSSGAGTPPAQFNQNPPPLIGSTPPLVTSSGWVVVLGPKTTFTPADLSSGVPADLMPGD